MIGDIMLKHYVEFLFPGIIVDESQCREVKSRDYRRLRKIPDGCYGFRFFDRTETRIDGEKLYGDNKNYSEVYYIDAYQYTLQDIKDQFPEQEILIFNMEANAIKKVVKTRCGNWKPFNKEDKVI
jgi:hypothetical protein